MTTAKLIGELMAAYDDYRAKWIAKNGSDAGFNEWFTKQIRSHENYTGPKR